jgi:hypothetical protein
VAAIRDKAKKFHKFVKGLNDKYGTALPDMNAPLLERFIFYLLFYSNATTNARKAVKAFTNEQHFTSWNEVRVATVREITEILEESRIQHADFLAPRLKKLLQRVFEEADDTALEPLTRRIEEAEKGKRQVTEKVKKFLLGLEQECDIPSWGPTYMITGLELDNAIPWDPHTEAVLDSQKVFAAKSTLTQKKRVAKALLDGLELGPLEVHHLLIEHAKRGAKGK